MLVEKPLADSVAEGRTMVDLAGRAGLVLMCDHTYCYTPAVQQIRELVGSGELGELHFVDSVRINLGLVQPDIDVLWDLAPHDLSILDFVLPAGVPTAGVGAHGADPIGAGRACVGHLTLPLPDDGARARARQLAVPDQDPPDGDRRLAAHAGVGRPQPAAAARIYDRGVDVARTSDAGADRAASTVSYRLGDMVARRCPSARRCGSMVDEFAAAIREGRPALTDGRSGLRVLEVLEAASQRPAPTRRRAAGAGVRRRCPARRAATSEPVMEGVR